MYSEVTVLELVDLIYRAAGDPAGWGSLCHRLGEVCDGTTTNVIHRQIPSQQSNVSDGWNVDPACVSEYESYYGSRNIWRTFRPHLLSTESVNTSEMMCPEELLLRSEFYNDFLRRHDLFHCLVATLRNDETTSSYLTIERPKSSEGFGDEHCRLLRLLVPHLARALQLHDRIQGLEKKADVLEESLDRVSAAIALVDSRGRVLYLNRPAAALFQQQKYLWLTPAGIQVARTSEHKYLTCLIRGATGTGSGAALHPGGTMNISRDGYHRPLHVLVSPLRTDALYLGKATPTAIIFITDPERKPWMPTEWLQQLYGLTPAEARLAQLLASGNSLKEASEQLEVAMSTVRSQLNSVFAKTNTKRQSELMHVLLMSPTLPSEAAKIVRNSDH